MAKKSQMPPFLRLGNMLTTTLMRAGFKLMGPGKYPMYLFTVRGRKSGLPRTIPIVIIEQHGRRYVSSPYGVVDWIRNLRAAGEAVLTRGRHSETVRAIELSPQEGGLVLQADIHRNPFASYFGINTQSSLEDFERAATGHPVFLLEAEVRV